MTVERDGQLVIACRPEVPPERLEKVIQDKRLWIYEKLLQKEALNPTPPVTKEFISGEGFYYLGRSYRLKLVHDTKQNQPLRFHQGCFLLQATAQADGREHFIYWYRTHLQTQLEQMMPPLSRRVGAEPRSLQVRDLGYRWGSCGQKGDISIHWRVAMLPKRMIEYVLVHELVHLIEHQHSPEFWDRLERILPDFDKRRSWLAEQGTCCSL
ncbi:M48 family metallopeptidase [Pantanalinema sp. GBBB05]|uniref:M48 family metallopeptidase n=1 Tax=Pantanalinema sp. GBBB05 TaxID=2604139 RepID=UPI001DD35C60|nr:M48 family metallopeptidase [Pantanalinema sp. GBBB05]